MPTEEQIEAAARRMWRDQHGYIMIHDSVLTPESAEAELDRTGYGVWDGPRISSVVKDAFRRRAEAALRAAEEAGPWEYKASGRARTGFETRNRVDPDDVPMLLRRGYAVWRRRAAVPAGEWEEVPGGVVVGGGECESPFAPDREDGQR